MKTAIVYYSMGGNTEFAARQLANMTGADLIRIEPEKPYPSKGVFKFIFGGKSAVSGETPKLKSYPFDADRYDRVVIATPVWASSPVPPVRTFIKENRSALASKRIAALVCFSGGGAAGTLEKLRALLDVSAFEAECILVDPKDKPSAHKIEQIRAFADLLNG